MFEKHKLEKEAKAHQASHATWEHEDAILRGVLDLVRGGGGLGGGGPAEVPLVLKKGERSVFMFTGGGLFEPRRGPGHYRGASQGFSIPVGNSGVRYRIGQSRGTFVQGDEAPTIIDTGPIVMTTARVVFLGAKRTVEWAFAKLIAVQHYHDRPWTAIQVSNRQKVTGITYDAANEHNLRLRLEAALALFNTETAELDAQLQEAITAHDAARPADVITAGVPGTLGPAASIPPPQPLPAPAASTKAPSTPAAWYTDPAKGHEYRFWDGSRWTDAVADRGVQGVDPP